MGRRRSEPAFENDPSFENAVHFGLARIDVVQVLGAAISLDAEGETAGAEVEQFELEAGGGAGVEAGEAILPDARARKEVGFEFESVGIHEAEGDFDFAVEGVQTKKRGPSVAWGLGVPCVEGEDELKHGAHRPDEN